MEDKGSRRLPWRGRRWRRHGVRSNRQTFFTSLSKNKHTIFTGILLTAVVALLFALFSLLQPPSMSMAPNGATEVSYSQFVAQIKAGNMLAVTFQDGGVHGLLATPLAQKAPTASVPARSPSAVANDIANWNRYVSSGYSTWPASASGTPAAVDPARALYARLPVDGDPQLMSLLASKHVVVNSLPASQAPFWLSLLWRLLPFVLFALLLSLLFASRRGNRTSMRSMDERITQMGRSRARLTERVKEKPGAKPGKAEKSEKSAWQAPPRSPLSAAPRQATTARPATTPAVTFADVAGIDEVRTELEEIVQFLRSPERYNRLGARIPRGALLVGPPGTGKTLLAKAVAGEAGVPFFSISASEFVEMFVGVGASRVRDLFNQARKSSPCVIFIDEIDAVGRKRAARMTSNDERDQTLNQLLVELDGFDERQAVVVLAATNRVDILDRALLRPGRFDRHITVSLPDRAGRQAILEVHTRHKPLHEDVDLQRLARMTPGMSGADLANLVNEAALGAARRDLERLTQECFEEALSRIQLGALRPIVMSEEEKRIIAFHEGGHALVAYHLPEADNVNCVTILPRGQSLGVTQFIPEEDRYNYSRQTLMARIAVGLGGRTAEELTFGSQRVTTGAENDLQVVTDLARRMVTRWGMSEEVGVIFADSSADSPAFGMNMRRVDLEASAKARSLIADDEGRLYLNGAETPRALFATTASFGRGGSATLAALIDTEVQRILNDGRAMARAILSEHSDQLTRLADALLEREHLNRAEFEELLRE